MTDRELLELAAKAAGDPIEAWTADADFVPVAILRSGARWQPLLKNRLTDCMGDALRLAVDLKLQITPECYGPECSAYSAGRAEAHVPSGSDPHAATRRAIVRAAAKCAPQ